jgi:hypothetical protein
MGSLDVERVAHHIPAKHVRVAAAAYFVTRYDGRGQSRLRADDEGREMTKDNTKTKIIWPIS